MCGRTGLNLCAADVQRACVYKKKNQDEFHTPEWVDEYNLDKEYKPSYNIAPTEVTPVLVSSANFGMGDNDEQILKPMMWGMVPPWHKGSYKNHGLSTNNCRLEGITSSKLYGSALRSGNRCVVLAEGFYEWQTTNSSKQPYYIYSNQEEGIKMEDPSSWGNSPPRLLRMAGLYGVWEGQEAGEEGEGGSLYSYSVLTLEAGSSFNWLHHRVPALLETDQQVADWLDVDRVPHSSATAMFSSSPPLSWHPVSSTVNNSRNKSPDCNRPILLKARTSGSRGLMEAWLRKPVDTEPQSKKIKKDDI